MLKKINKKTIFIILAIGCIFILKSVWNAYEYRYVSATKEKIDLYISNDFTLDSIVNNLSPALKNSDKFIKYAKKHGLEKSINSGKYSFPKAAPYAQIIRYIKASMQQEVTVTFNNTRTLDALAGKISQRLDLDSVKLASYLKNENTAQKYGFTAENFIAMFIPNTYNMYWDYTCERFVERMYKEHNNFWSKQRLAKAKKLEMTPLEVSTLAAIVFEETKMSDEMPTIAGVYINRLKTNMPLQADPTLKFAIGDFSLRRILYKHLKIDSPYNTYKYKGLPPAPICMPSIKAIDAVLNYEKHDYLFFCANPNFSGYHSFARTLKEHNENAKSYSKALNKAKIYK